MNNRYLGVFFKTGILAILFYIINIVLVPLFLIPDVEYYYPIPIVYLFFFVFSIIILGILIKISEKNIGQLGYAFLLLTSIKMAASYIFAKPIIAKSIEFPTEKVNFFAVFVLFLAIEAYFTARLLNNKQ